MKPRWQTPAVTTLLLSFCIGKAVGQSAASGVRQHLATAREEIKTAHLSEAEQELRDALRLDPQAFEAHFLLGNIFFLENRPKESLAEYTAGARGRAPTAEELTTVASDYVLLNDLPDADRWFHYAVKLDPANARAWYLLGRAQYSENHVADAEASFRRALALHPQDVRAEYNLGLTEEKLQRASEAESAYRTAIGWQSGLAKQDPQPYLDLGMLLLGQGKASEALTELQAAARFGPGNPLTQQELGRTFETLERYDDALAALHRAVALAPEAQQPHFFLARVLKHLGRSGEAATEYAIVAKMLGSRSDTPTPNLDRQP